MFDIVSDAIEQLKDDENTNVPDILKSSSEVIYEIITECIGNDVPEYVRTLTIDDYFGEKITGKHAIDVISDAWKFSKKSFEVDKHHNELRYNAGDNFEAARLMKELPETLEAHKSREFIVMDLEAAIEYFGINFKKKTLWF